MQAAKLIAGSILGRAFGCFGGEPPFTRAVIGAGAGSLQSLSNTTLTAGECGTQGFATDAVLATVLVASVHSVSSLSLASSKTSLLVNRTPFQALAVKAQGKAVKFGEHVFSHPPTGSESTRNGGESW